MRPFLFVLFAQLRHNPPSMSATKSSSRIGTTAILARKGGEPVTVLTAYTAPMAQLLDGKVDALLVGDSLGMVLYGLDSTLAVTLDMMVAHGRAVVKASARSCVIIDMPFGSYQESPEQAFRNCAHVLAQTGAQGVKLEGGKEMAETIRFITERGIPVMGHVGLMPQHVQRMGGYKVQGREASAGKAIMADAQAVADAGAFSMVIEGVVEKLAREITEKVAIPTIGIGASSACDGQVLVTEDMLGLTPRAPKFVKQYAAIGEAIAEAVDKYAADVKARKFPSEEQTYK